MKVNDIHCSILRQCISYLIIQNILVGYTQFSLCKYMPVFPVAFLFFMCLNIAFRCICSLIFPKTIVPPNLLLACFECRNGICLSPVIKTFCNCNYLCRVGEGCLIMISTRSFGSLGCILSGAVNFCISSF